MKNVLIFGSSSSIASEMLSSGACPEFRFTHVSSSLNKTYSSEVDFHEIPDYSESSISLLFDSIGCAYDGLFIANGSGYVDRQISISEQWNRLFEINLFAPVRIVEHFVSRREGNLCSESEASIVITSSIASMHNVGAPDAYSCAKAGINRYVKSKANIFNSLGLRINAILPGHMLSRTWDRISKENPSRVTNFINKCSVKRLARPSDIVALAEFLLSDRSSYINGQLISVDSAAFLSHQ